MLDTIQYDDESVGEYVGMWGGARLMKLQRGRALGGAEPAEGTQLASSMLSRHALPRARAYEANLVL